MKIVHNYPEKTSTKDKKMKRPKMLILSGIFPFENGEPFLEQEVELLADHFDVFILPCGAKSTEQTYCVPKNVNILYKEAEIIIVSRKRLFPLLKYLLFSIGLLVGEGFRNPCFFHPLGFAKALWRAIRANIIAPIIGRICKEENIDIIYSYWMSYEALAAIIAVKKLGSKVITLTRAHGHDLYDYANYPKFCPFQDYIINNIDHVVTISKDGENYLKARYDSQSKKITTFRLGVSPGAISEPSNDGSFRIVSCSAMKPLKRVNLIAQTLQFIDFPVEWVHIGDGPDRENIKRTIDKVLAIKPNVSVKLLGNVPNHEVLNFYETHPVDLFINVSSSEGIPVSIMEAQSRGIPAIASDVGGNSEIIDEKIGNGWLIPVEFTSKELGTLITKIKEQSLYLPAKEIAYLVWKNNYDSTNNHERFAKWLLKKCKKKSAPDPVTFNKGF